jgi:hypothetical protein
VSGIQMKEQARARRIRLGDLLPDAQNRTLRQWRVDQIARSFDFGKWTPPVVRENGVGHVIIDGHHGIAAACKRGLEDLYVICYVHPHVDADARVGEMYIGINDTLASTPAERFLMRLRAEDPVAVAVTDLILANGFTGVVDQPTDGAIHCPTHCEWVYRGGMFRRRTGDTPAALVFALRALKATYGTKRSAIRPEIIRGLGCFSHRYPRLTFSDTARKIHARHPEPGDLIQAARVMAEAMRCQGYKAMALVIRQDYNVGRHNGGLEQW